MSVSVELVRELERVSPRALLTLAKDLVAQKNTQGLFAIEASGILDEPPQSRYGAERIALLTTTIGALCQRPGAFARIDDFQHWLQVARQSLPGMLTDLVLGELVEREANEGVVAALRAGYDPLRINQKAKISFGNSGDHLTGVSPFGQMLERYTGDLWEWMNRQSTELGQMKLGHVPAVAHAVVEGHDVKHKSIDAVQLCFMLDAGAVGSRDRLNSLLSKLDMTSPVVSKQLGDVLVDRASSHSQVRSQADMERTRMLGLLIVAGCGCDALVSHMMRANSGATGDLLTDLVRIGMGDERPGTMTKAVQNLVLAGLPVDWTRDPLQRTGLHTAMEFDNPEAAQALLEAGANPDACTIRGQSARQVATKYKRSHLVAMLDAHQAQLEIRTMDAAVNMGRIQPLS